jgi:hypothetical protein
MAAKLPVLCAATSRFVNGVTKMKDVRLKFNLMLKIAKLSGVLGVAGYLVYRGESYNDPQGSLVAVTMCALTALSLVLTGVTWVGREGG